MPHRLFLFIGLIFALTSVYAQNFVRKPYLQKLGPNQVTFKFRLNLPAEAKLFVGVEVNNLEQKKSSASALDHEILLENLLPNTKYFYKVQLGDLPAASDTSNYFRTAPTVGSKTKFTFWSVGDLYPGPQQAAVYEGFKKFRKGKYTNLFLTVGDNVYMGGGEDSYQSNFFDVYQNGSILQQSGLFPSTGNHDYDGFNRLVDNPAMAYFNSFALPSKAELGGLASNSEAYYSYDYGNVHFVVLDSYAYGVDGKRLFEVDNQQLNWLKADLIQSKQDWTIVYMHFPIYTKGSYDSDAVSDLIKLRETLAPVFDQYKVDLVLTGHSHTMERSKPTVGHYGLSSTFDAAIHQPQLSSGLFDGSENSCPYLFDQSQKTKSGVIYVTNGASGATGRPAGFGKHPVMFFDKKDKIGSFFGEVDGNKLVGKFIDDEGKVMDQFTVLKSKDGTCANCFNTQPNFGCGPSGKPSLLANPLTDYCKDQLVDLTAKGDSLASFTWYDAKGLVVKSNKISLNNSVIGKNTVQVSQVVNGFESEKLTLSMNVHTNPVLENLITTPLQVLPNTFQDFSVKLSDSIKTYTWTLPAGWEGSSQTNSIKIKPTATAGDVKVFGTSSFGCKSNEVKQTVTPLVILATQEPNETIKMYPNPVVGNTITILVPENYIGKEGQWVNSQGQVLSTHKIQNNMQQLLVPISSAGVLLYRVVSQGEVLYVGKVVY